jgi:cation transporter-like permease
MHAGLAERSTVEASWRRRAALSLGVSIFLLVVGAILAFAVDVTTSGFNLNTVGVILMVAGALGLVLSLLFWSSFSPYRRSRTVAGPDTVVEERRIERDLPWHRSELLRSPL